MSAPSANFTGYFSQKTKLCGLARSVKQVFAEGDMKKAIFFYKALIISKLYMIYEINMSAPSAYFTAYLSRKTKLWGLVRSVKQEFAEGEIKRAIFFLQCIDNQ